MDRAGYNFDLFEFSVDGGINWFTVTDGAGTLLTLGNVCAYPILELTLEEGYCEEDNILNLGDFIQFDDNPSITNPNPIFTPDPMASATFTIDGIAATAIDLNTFGSGTYTIEATYLFDTGAGFGGTDTNPAIGTNSACPIIVNTTLVIAPTPSAPLISLSLIHISEPTRPY